MFGEPPHQKNWDYSKYNYCLVCRREYPKSSQIRRCDQCKQLLRTYPRSKSERVRVYLWLLIISAIVVEAWLIASERTIISANAVLRRPGKVMAFIDYDKNHWCTKCSEKRSVSLIYCPDCGSRLRYKRRMTHSLARAARLERNKQQWHSQNHVPIRRIAFVLRVRSGTSWV